MHDPEGLIGTVRIAAARRRNGEAGMGGILAGLLAACLLAVACGCTSAERGMPAGPLESCSWTLGGGMRGGHETIAMERAGDGAAVRTERAEWHGTPVEAAVHAAPASALDEIAAIFRSRRMAAWRDLPMGGIRTLDGDTWSMSFLFAGDGSLETRLFRIHQEQELPDGAADAVREILGIMRASAAGNGGTAAR